MRTFRALLLGSSFGAALAAASCQAFSGSDDKTALDQDAALGADGDTQADGGAGMVGAGDGSSDAAILLDGFVPSPCATPIHSATMICDDFDDPDRGYAMFWAISNTVGGVIGATTTTSRSAPGSLGVTIDPSDDGGPGQFCDLSADINFAPQVHVDIDFNVAMTGDASANYAEIVDLNFDDGTIASARIVLGQNDVLADIDTYSGGQRNGFLKSGDSAGSRLDGWHHARADFVFDANAGSVMMTIDGKAFSAMTTMGTMPSPPPTKIRVLIGDSPGTNGPATVYLDNIVVTATP